MNILRIISFKLIKKMLYICNGGIYSLRYTNYVINIMHNAIKLFIAPRQRDNYVFKLFT